MKVNGEEKVLEKEILLSEYLEQEGYQTGRIAVERNGERNGEIIPKRNYKETILHNDDVLEVVSFVGGG